jgi:regulatory protein
VEKVPTPADPGFAAPDAPDPEALDRALRFIEYRPRSAGETRARLMRWGYDAGTCERVTEYLQAAGIIDDRDFAGLFMDELVRKGLGCYRVRSELLKKKLDRQLVEEVMEAYPMDEELARATTAAERRYTQMRAAQDPAARRRLSEYLMRRGYSRPVAVAACRLTVQVDTQTGAELE